MAIYSWQYAPNYIRIGWVSFKIWQNILVCFLVHSVVLICTSMHYTVSQKNDTDVAHHNLDADQPMLIIFVRDVAESVLSNGDLLSNLS